MSLSPGYPEPFRLEVDTPLTDAMWTMNVSTPTNKSGIRGSSRFNIRSRPETGIGGWRLTILEDGWGRRTDWRERILYVSFGDQDRVYKDSNPDEVIDACSKGEGDRLFRIGLGVYEGRPSWFVCK